MNKLFFTFCNFLKCSNASLFPNFQLYFESNTISVTSHLWTLLYDHVFLYKTSESSEMKYVTPHRNTSCNLQMQTDLCSPAGLWVYPDRSEECSGTASQFAVWDSPNTVITPLTPPTQILYKHQNTQSSKGTLSVYIHATKMFIMCMQLCICLRLW